MNLLWKINDELYNEVIQFKKNNTWEFKDENLLNVLISNRIIVEDDNVDIDNYILQHQMKVFERGYLGYTIMPTLDCNFRCPYCFEDNVRQKTMSKKVENRTIKYIKNNAKNVSLLDITWYGGEPLLNFGSIERITSEIKKLKCEFNASMVTNGYLLTSEIIDKLDDLHIRSIQITLDGPKEIHNQKRPHYKNNDSYDKIIENIDKLISRKENKTRLSVRVNIDRENSDKFIEVYNYFKNLYGEKVHVYPGIIKDWTGKLDGFNCMLNKKDEVKFKIEQYEKHGIVPASFFPSHTSPCVAQRMYDYVIGPEGELYKCWSDVGNPDNIVGSIFNDNANVNLLTKYLISIDAFKSEKCKDCFYLFICGGGCPCQQLKNKFNGTSFDTCTVFKNNIDKFLEIHFETKKPENIEELIY